MYLIYIVVANADLMLKKNDLMHSVHLKYYCNNVKIFIVTNDSSNVFLMKESNHF